MNLKETIKALPLYEQAYLCYSLLDTNNGNITKLILGKEYKTAEELRPLYVEQLNKELDIDRMQELKNIGMNYIKGISKENPLLKCEQENKQLIDPNEKRLKEGKAFINISIIKGVFTEALKIYDADNGLYYLDNGNKLIEFDPKEQYDLISVYYSYLKRITKLIVPLHKLKKVEPVKTVASNYDLIKFRDGIYNIKTYEQIDNIQSIKDIPSCHIDVQNTFKPSFDDIQKTQQILQHIFVEPESFINRCKDIYFNREYLKGFTIIYGTKHSGKSYLVRKEILTRLFNDKDVQASNFNRVLEREDLQTNGLTLSVDETQDKIMDSSFLNKFTGNNTVHISRKNTTGIDIKTSHVFLIGETVPELHNATDGTYARVYLVETHNDIRDLDQSLLEYAKTTDFTDTIYCMVKEAYKKHPEITEKPVDVDTYNEKKKDITLVLSKYIYSTPKDNLGYSEEQSTNINPCDIVRVATQKQPVINTSETGYRLSLDAIKELIDIAYEEDLLDKKYDTSKIARDLSNKILPQIIEDYDNKYEKQVNIKGNRIKIKLDIAPTPEALKLLQQHGLDIEQFHLMNKI